MKTRSFGPTGVEVSEVGLGCWQLGGADWGDVSEELALAILRSAWESGVTFFDAADVYGSGRSEALIGRFLREANVRGAFVATKVGRTPDLYPDHYTEGGLRAAVEASLGRIGVDCLDLVQLHCIPTEILRRGEVFGWLRRLQADGMIRFFGASVETMEEAELCLREEGIASLQIIFNIFRQKAIETLFPRLADRQVAVIVRLPLASGLLSGKFTKDKTFAMNDHRRFNADGQQFNVGETFAGLPFEKGVELADGMKVFVPEGLTMVQMAMRWILDFPEVTVVIPGASSDAQVRENASVSQLPALTPQLHERLARYERTMVRPFIRGPY